MRAPNCNRANEGTRTTAGERARCQAKKPRAKRAGREAWHGDNGLQEPQSSRGAKPDRGGGQATRCRADDDGAEQDGSDGKPARTKAPKKRNQKATRTETAMTRRSAGDSRDSRKRTRRTRPSPVGEGRDARHWVPLSWQRVRSTRQQASVASEAVTINSLLRWCLLGGVLGGEPREGRRFPIGRDTPHEAALLK